jgi:D-alanyl-lipoteichoic acid acyltransferase DltB (MBOAT superfamily)
MMGEGADTIALFGELCFASIVAVPLYHCLPWRWARCVLLSLCGAWLLFTLAPRLLLFYLAYWLLLFGLQRLAAMSHETRAASWVLGGGLLLALAPLLLWKLFPYEGVVGFNLHLHRALNLLWAGMGSVDASKNILIPVGLSFASFRAADMLIQTRLGLLGPLRLSRLMCYGLYPPIQLVGPVAEYRELALEGPVERFDPGDLAAGLANIGMGLGKLFVLAYPLSMAGDLQGFQAQTAGSAWLHLVAFAWYLYLNFAGYSDLAIGFARLFGHRLKPNFEFPFFTAGPAQFWQAWHMSLSRFAWRNVFIPAGGMRSRTQYLALLLTMLVIAFWHTLNLPMLLFGLYHASGLMLQRWLARRRKSETTTGVLARSLKVVGTFLYVAVSLPLLVLPWEQLPGFYTALLEVRP